jgi:hypothetical protein
MTIRDCAARVTTYSAGCRNPARLCIVSLCNINGPNNDAGAHSMWWVHCMGWCCPQGEATDMVLP